VGDKPDRHYELSLRAPDFGARNLLSLPKHKPIPRCARDDKSDANVTIFRELC
jgi:hypothetical protein